MSLPTGVSLTALEQVPGMAPPPGKEPHLSDPTFDGSLRPPVIAIGAIFAAFTILCCALRIYTRVWVVKSAGWDDVWVAIATVCACAYTGLVLSSAAVLVDVHQWDVSAAELIKYLPLLRAIGYVYFVPVLLSTKIALASFFLRLFSVKKMLRISIWATIVWSVFVSFFALFWSIARCSPIGLAYAECSSKSAYPYVVAAALNIATDLALLVIPLWGIFSLQMHFKRRIAISLIFFTGITAVLASCLGLYYRIVQFNSPDQTWNFGAVNILSMFEVDTTVIVACLPAIPGLFKDKNLFLDRIGSTINSVKQALLATNRSVASSIGNRFGGKNSSRKQSIGSDLEAGSNKITVQSDIYQMEDSRQERSPSLSTHIS